MFKSQKLASITFALCIYGNCLSAQEISVKGIVFDNESKQRLSRVYIYNSRKKEGFYNNFYGEFKDKLLLNDTLITSLKGYRPDTIKMIRDSIVLFFLKRDHVQLQEVVILGKKKQKNKLEEAKSEYNDAYVKGNIGQLFPIDKTRGGFGIGLSIDALYKLFSKEGRNARKLQRTIEQDYREAIITDRYTPTLVNQTTGLAGKELLNFVQAFRPSYQCVVKANEYELILFIKNQYQRYRQDTTILNKKYQ